MSLSVAGTCTVVNVGLLYSSAVYCNKGKGTRLPLQTEINHCFRLSWITVKHCILSASTLLPVSGAIAHSSI